MLEETVRRQPEGRGVAPGSMRLASLCGTRVTGPDGRGAPAAAPCSEDGWTARIGQRQHRLTWQQPIADETAKGEIDHMTQTIAEHVLERMEARYKHYRGQGAVRLDRILLKHDIIAKTLYEFDSGETSLDKCNGDVSKVPALNLAFLRKNDPGLVDAIARGGFGIDFLNRLAYLAGNKVTGGWEGGGRYEFSDGSALCADSSGYGLGAHRSWVSWLSACRWSTCRTGQKEAEGIYSLSHMPEQPVLEITGDDLCDCLVEEAECVMFDYLGADDSEIALEHTRPRNGLLLGSTSRSSS